MKRDWNIPTLTVEGRENFDEAYGLISELTTVVLRLGGVVAIAPHRIETESGFVTDRVLVKYDSYAPGLNAQAQARAEENGKAEPEPVEAE